MIFLILFLALLPVVVLILYICFRDRKSPEPPGQLVKTFFLGTLALPLSLLISVPLESIGAYPDEQITLLDGIRGAFFGAAIPEELTKLFLLWLVVRKNKYFDEKMDGIVYAVCISLGFAAVENILYVAFADSFLLTGIIRALFSVPGHFSFAVLMGYYYSLAKFYPKGRKKNIALMMIAPILAHGIFNSILLSAGAFPYAIWGVLVIFPLFCYYLWKYAHKRMDEHLQRDIMGEEEINEK